MIVFESKKTRRIVLRLERGEDLVAELESLAEREGIEAAWVRGIGSLAWAELDRHDQARRVAEPPQRFEMPCDILTLEGNLSILGGAPRAQLYATLARRTDNGVDVLGGRLRAGEVFACELVLEVFEDLRLSRARDEKTGLALWTGRSEPSAPAPTKWTAVGGDEEDDRDEDEDEDDNREDEDEEPSGGVSWADVAAVSAAPPVEAPPARSKRKAGRGSREPAFRPAPIPDKRRDADFLDEPHPQKGDFIEHRQFGLCKIDRENDDGGLMIRLPSGVRKVIKLDFMEVGRPRMEGTRRVYPVRPRRR